MKISIKREVFEQFNKDFLLGVVIARGIDNTKTRNELRDLLSELQKLMQSTFRKQTAKARGLISGRAAALAEYGDVHSYATELQQLMQKALQGKQLASGNALADIVTYVSLKHLFPAAAEDIGKGKKEKKVISFHLPQAAVQHDWKKLRKMLQRKAKEKKPTRGSSNVLIHFEVVPPVSRKQLSAVLDEAARMIKLYCGEKSKISVALLDKRKPSAVIR